MITVHRTLFVLFVLMSANLFAADTVVVEKLAVDFASVESVSIFFVNRTENYVYSANRVEQESTIRIYRDCGLNCANVFKKVLLHMKQAKSANCLPGQQNVLIKIGNVSNILYSYSGRMILFNGKCYFNNQSINDVIEEKEFIFNN